jgi:hypothetical protein
MRPYNLKWAGLQTTGNRPRCKPSDIGKHDMHVQTVILQLTQYLLCLLLWKKMWCGTLLTSIVPVASAAMLRQACMVYRAVLFEVEATVLQS